ncbi:P-II family nitrogen regulator [Alginatibacterium sediminis]|uniref:P-II family nitrogen regulator n=1 Tax=Alginatibacterium sediminis TaxID=2164068 RepID=A0A420E9Z0_9ALTE|nr:P-II family nitrogen regulator [Alginatibacterium sediminis]RKF17497.1 P-II family nitrogen regulator [Alginatibacterium sediminis]
MEFKLIVAFIDDKKTALVLDAARAAGATGATVIDHARGEGVRKHKTFFGLSLESQCDVLLFVVESHRAQNILSAIQTTAGFDQEQGQGIAVLIDVEQAVGVAHQIQAITDQRER